MTQASWHIKEDPVPHNVEHFALIVPHYVEQSGMLSWWDLGVVDEPLDLRDLDGWEGVRLIANTSINSLGPIGWHRAAQALAEDRNRAVLGGAGPWPSWMDVIRYTWLHVDDKQTAFKSICQTSHHDPRTVRKLLNGAATWSVKWEMVCSIAKLLGLQPLIVGYPDFEGLDEWVQWPLSDVHWMDDDMAPMRLTAAVQQVWRPWSPSGLIPPPPPKMPILEMLGKVLQDDTKSMRHNRFSIPLANLSRLKSHGAGWTCGAVATVVHKRGWRIGWVRAGPGIG